jgi:hypothetical protein
MFMPVHFAMNSPVPNLVSFALRRSNKTCIGSIDLGHFRTSSQIQVRSTVKLLRSSFFAIRVSFVWYLKSKAAQSVEASDQYHVHERVCISFV